MTRMATLPMGEGSWTFGWLGMVDDGMDGTPFMFMDEDSAMHWLGNVGTGEAGPRRLWEVKIIIGREAELVNVKPSLRPIGGDPNNAYPWRQS